MSTSRRLPPGPSELPFIGSTFAISRNPPEFLDGLYRRHGDVATFTVAGQRFFAFFHPRAVKHILVDNARNFTNREAYPELRMLVGDGLLTIDPPEHREQRRIAQPAFHRTRIERYGQTMVARALRMIETWRDGAAFDVAGAMQDLTLGIAGETLFGIDLAAESAPIEQAFLQTAEFTDLASLSPGRLPIDLPFTPYGRYRRARRRLDEVVLGIIARRRAEGQDRGDVLSMLLAATDEAGGILRDAQVRDHVLTFLAAGHATTANALTWTFYLLAQHPTVAGRLADELADVLGGREPTVDDLALLPYLDQVFKETMRLYPPAWIQLRHVVGDCVIDGQPVPGGSFVLVSQWVTHRRADLWRDADRFLPERFDPVRGEAPEGLAYFPFGAGPRTCIGMPFAQMEGRLVLATILQRFRLELEPGFPVVPRALVILRPRYGLRMRLHARAESERAATPA